MTQYSSKNFSIDSFRDFSEILSKIISRIPSKIPSKHLEFAIPQNNHFVIDQGFLWEFYQSLLWRYPQSSYRVFSWDNILLRNPLSFYWILFYLNDDQNINFSIIQKKCPKYQQEICFPYSNEM